MTSLDDFNRPPIITQSGMVLVNKPAGITSHDVVRQARKIFLIRKIGHCGTLDPFSEGLLLLLVGEAVSLQQYFTTRHKTYRALFKFGVTTDSLDPTGKVTKTDPEFQMPSRQEIQNLIDSQFLGEICQTPPSYSAVKVKGQRAYALARAGKEVILPKRTIRVNHFSILSMVNREIEVQIECSSGTYIRTLANDLAQCLGTVGMVESLIREKIGSFTLEEAVKLEELDQMEEGLPQKSFEELHLGSPGIIPINVLLEREPTLRGTRINCTHEELYRAKNGNFSFPLIKRQNGIFHLFHRNTAVMVLQKKSDKIKVLFNILKYFQ